MKVCIKNIILCAILAFSGISYADITPPVTSTEKASPSTNKAELLNYLNEVLKDAGFSDSTRKYLVNIADGQFSKIKSSNLSEKKRLLERNLYIFLKEMSEKHQTPTSSDVIQKQYYLADQQQEPWKQILSKPVLQSFKENHIFDELSIEDIEDENKKFCSAWPFCK